MIPILSGNVASALPSGYDVANSCMFDGVNGYMSFAPASHMNMDRWTFSAWVKRSKLGAVQTIFNCDNAASDLTELQFDANDKLHFENLVSNSIKGKRVTTRVFRDVSAWINIVVVWDSGNATAGDRIKIYINGVQETTFDTSDDPVQDVNSSFGENNQPIRLGTLDESAAFFSGYIAEVVILDGTAAAVTDFGEFDEDSPQIWKPKDVSGLTFGSQGAYLDFEDSGDLGDDESGNGNDFTESNLAATDQSIDTPTLNYPILNSVAQNFGSNNDRFLEGALKYYCVDVNWESAFSTFGFTKGKWYWEVKVITLASSNGYANLGVQDYDLLGSSGNTNANFIANSASAGMELDYRGGANNNIISAGSSVQQAGVDWAADDIIGFAADMDNKKLYIHKGGTYLTVGGSVGDPTSGSTGTGAIAIPSTFTTCTPAIGIYGANAIFHFNFGSANYNISSSNSDANSQGSFEHSVPSGYFALNSSNLAEYG